MPKEIKEAIIAMLSGIPESLIEERSRLGVSQQQLADKLGVSQQQVARYESSRYQSVKLSGLIAIAQVLFAWNDDEP